MDCLKVIKSTDRIDSQRGPMHATPAITKQFQFKKNSGCDPVTLKHRYVRHYLPSK